MVLIVGGTSQGKRQRALELFLGKRAPSVVLGEDCPLEGVPAGEVFCGLHRYIRRLMESGKDPVGAVESLAGSCPEIVITCDEIGCGIVPLDPFEREWREVTGRILCSLAARASRVERVTCGIPQVLKGEKECS